ncbi:DUF6249 domain-containing protein [Tenacibaculum jejuense]|uniref:DUF6249 domain-containing protein n=1 Tax=Tenacibaculum jejuense TaxID=584609 RepID=A0A238UAI3_9FLAO|nr:DUF6249 domain-containing protein [Tenacibaculum jejuense]SNR15420.1 conserved membrane protein of unknown function [Tenacibaculum jejuense]
MEVALVFISFFAVIFGIFYLYYSTRNRERLALIEKGQEAKIFSIGERKRSTLTGRIVILNFALLLMGIGVGILLGAMLSHYFAVPIEEQMKTINSGRVIIESHVFYTSSIFLCGGGALLLGFYLTKKLDKE